VGTIAVQAAKVLGAGRVVAAARLERLHGLGADATVRIGDHDDLAAPSRMRPEAPST
jgi:NADPH2:quinone reductase